MIGLLLVALGAMVIPLSSSFDAQAARLRNLPHVRGEDPRAHEILEKVRVQSPTAAALIAELQESDVIVIVVTGWVSGRVAGVTYVVATTPTVRYVRVVLRLPNTDRELMAILGHELQHAVEIARMPGVKDARSLAAAFKRIGEAMARNTNFETQAAVKAGRRVALEVGPDR